MGKGNKKSAAAVPARSVTVRSAKPAAAAGDWHPGLFGERRRTWLVALASLVVVLVVTAICVTTVGANRDAQAKVQLAAAADSFEPADYAKRFTDQLVAAPVDYKTGDIYVPEAKLRLARPERAASLTYVYSGAGSSTVTTSSGQTEPVELVEQLKVIDQRVMNKLVATAEDASGEDRLNERNHLTRCGQGVSVVFDSDSRPALYDAKLYKLTRLSNGKSMYVYFDRLCPEFRQTAELLSQAQPF